MRSRVALSLAALGVLTAAACGGSPDPANAGGTSSAAQATTTKAAVNRPRQLKLEGVQPCSLLTAAQLKQFKVDRPSLTTSKDQGAPACDFFGTKVGGSYRVTTQAHDGIDSWTNGSRPGTTKEVASVEGFPAVGHVMDADQGGCDVVVDVADGQSLVVILEILPGSESDFPEKCEGARQFADAAMKTLLATH